MNAAGTETYFDKPEVIQALAYWVDLSRKHKVMPTGVIEWGTTPKDFFEKKIAMMWTTTGNLTNVKNNAKFDFGVAMLPESKRRGSPTGGGNFYVSPNNPSQSINLLNNLFDRTTIYQGVTVGNGYNGYITNCTTLSGSWGGDVITNSPAYETSWLGKYYVPTNSPLIDAGGEEAYGYGLYHFCTTANQVKEGTSNLDIGWHMVATDSNGVPLDTDGDGIPDLTDNCPTVSNPDQNTACVEKSVVIDIRPGRFPNIVNLDSPLPLAVAIAKHVGEDPEQPGFAVGPGLEGVEEPIGPQHGVLDQVLGVLLVARHARRRRVQGR